MLDIVRLAGLDMPFFNLVQKINLHEIVQIDNMEIAKILLKYGAKGTDWKLFQATSN